MYYVSKDDKKVIHLEACYKLPCFSSIKCGVNIGSWRTRKIRSDWSAIGGR